MSTRKPEDCVVKINAYDFIKTLQIESNKLASKGIFLSGSRLFHFAGGVYSLTKLKSSELRRNRCD